MANFAVKALGGICTLMLVLFFLAFIAWFTVPRYLGLQSVIVLSGSMEPTLQTGGVALVKQRTAEEIQVGDVMTFQHPDDPAILVTHRVVEIVPGKDGRPAFHTRGDANNVTDDWLVPSDNVEGSVEWDLPYMGYVTQKVQSGLGFLLIIGIPSAIVVFGELKNIYRELRKRPQEPLDEARVRA